MLICKRAIDLASFVCLISVFAVVCPAAGSSDPSEDFNIPPDLNLRAAEVKARAEEMLKEKANYLITIITALPSLMSANKNDGHILNVGPSTAFVMSDLSGSVQIATLEASTTEVFHMVSTTGTPSIIDDFEDQLIYVYIPTNPEIAAAIGEVVHQKVHESARPRKALRIRGRPDRTNVLRFDMLEPHLGLPTIPSFVINTNVGTYPFAFFRFGDDVVVDVIDYNPPLASGDTRCEQLFKTNRFQ